MKRKLKIAAVRIYEFFITRIETYRATRMWQKGVNEARQLAKAINGPRIYLWYDKHSMAFICITHKPRPKDGLISMEELQKRKIIRAKRTMTVEDMKREPFYYTDSHHGAIGCDSDNALRLDKYKYWLTFHRLYVSEALQKLDKYKANHSLK